MIGVISNTLTETRYRRLDNRTQDDYALQEQDCIAEVKPGKITLLIPEVDEIQQRTAEPAKWRNAYESDRPVQVRLT